MPEIDAERLSAGQFCTPDSAGHCITCADQALEAEVLALDESTGMASVRVEGRTAEVDVSLIDSVEPGDTLLIHGGVALAIHNPKSATQTGVA
jgi:hydrogenase maturation factor